MDEFFQQFNAAGVRYLLIGGQAMRLYGMPRFSMDWDFFIPPTDIANINLINALLEKELDAPLVPLGSKGENFVQTFQTQYGVLQFHLGLPGVPHFEEAEKLATIRLTEGGVPVKCLCAKLLLAAKEKADRPQDQADILFLKELQKSGQIV